MCFHFLSDDMDRALSFFCILHALNPDLSKPSIHLPLGSLFVQTRNYDPKLIYLICASLNYCVG